MSHESQTRLLGEILLWVTSRMSLFRNSHDSVGFHRMSFFDVMKSTKSPGDPVRVNSDPAVLTAKANRPDLTIFFCRFWQPLFVMAPKGGLCFFQVRTCCIFTTSFELQGVWSQKWSTPLPKWVQSLEVTKGPWASLGALLGGPFVRLGNMGVS